MMPTNKIDRFEYKSEGGCQTFTVEWELGLIRCRSEGFWSPEQTAAHFEQLIRCVRTIQRSGRHAKVLADLRDSATQSREVADYMRHALDGVYRPGDRVAMLLSNTLFKMQLRRVLEGEVREYFHSLEEAERWLQADYAPAAAERDRGT